MVPLLGNLSLWLGLILSALQFINSVKKKYHLNSTNKKIIVKGLFFSILLSFISLMYCYVTSDFSVANVYQNSHTSKPLIYKISAVWGNHEGSMLLWLLVLCIFNYLIFKLFDEKNSSFIFKSLEIQSIIIFGFLLFTLLTSNPFEQIIPTLSTPLSLVFLIFKPFAGRLDPTVATGTWIPLFTFLAPQTI